MLGPCSALCSGVALTGVARRGPVASAIGRRILLVILSAMAAEHRVVFAAFWACVAELTSVIVAPLVGVVKCETVSRGDPVCC